MRKCAICSKGSIMAGTRKLLRGHYNPTGWTRKYPNLQKTRLGTGRRVLACVSCIKQTSKIAKPAIYTKKEAVAVK